MKKTDIDPLSVILPDYIQVEQEILKRVRAVSYGFCSRCAETCCAEQYCREAIESRFLSRLVRLQGLAYDQHKGWLGSRGCRLSYGRPMVCYEFFCEPFLTDPDFLSSNIQTLIKDFIHIGSRARGTSHLICMDNLDAISPLKIMKMRQRISGLSVRLKERTCL